jgi:hypothetical protein
MFTTFELSIEHLKVDGDGDTKREDLLTLLAFLDMLSPKIVCCILCEYNRLELGRIENITRRLPKGKLKQVEPRSLR